MVASTAFSARPGWSISRGIRWSVSPGIGGQFPPESGGQYQRILHLLITSRVEPNWNNLLYYYEWADNTFTDSIVTFINDDTNAEILSKTKIPRETGKPKESRSTDFIYELLKASELTDQIYHKVLLSVPYIYPDFDSSLVSTNHAKSLITQKILKFTSKNFESLKTHHNLHIEFIESNNKAFISEMDSYPLDTDDLLKVLKSTIFNNTQKSAVVSNFDEAEIISNSVLLKQIGIISFDDPTFIISNNISLAVLTTKTLSDSERISLLLKWSSKFTNANFESIFLTMNEPYRKLGEKQKRPSFTKTILHLSLANILEERKIISSIDRKDKEIIIRTKK